MKLMAGAVKETVCFPTFLRIPYLEDIDPVMSQGDCPILHAFLTSTLPSTSYFGVIFSSWLSAFLPACSTTQISYALCTCVL